MGRIKQKQIQLKNGATLTVRSPVPGDATRTIALRKTFMGETRFTLTQPDEVTTTEAQQIEWIQAHLDSPTQIAIMGEINGELVGCMNFENGLRRRAAHHGEFGMAVLLAWHGLGIGGILLNELIEWAKLNPTIEKIDLRVHSTNEKAIYLYKKFGFKEEGRAIRDLKFGPGLYDDTLLMGLFVKDIE